MDIWVIPFRRRPVRDDGSQWGGGAGGKLAMTIGRIDKLAIGAAETRDFPVAIGSLDALSSALGTKLDGIVGYDFLKHYRVTIDYEASKMHLD